jgi:hypothetical protein
MKSIKEIYDDCINELGKNNIKHPFRPSKTAQNCLNFIKTEEEKMLYSINITDDIWDMFRIIYILLNILPPTREQCVIYLYDTIMKEYDFNSISIIHLYRKLIFGCHY